MTKKSVTEGINRFLGYKESKAVMPLASHFGNRSKIACYNDSNQNAKVEGPQRFLGYSPAKAVLPLMSFLDRLRGPDNDDTMEPVTKGFEVIFMNPDDDNDGRVEGDQIEGGLADNMSISEFNPSQLMKGMNVEREHTNDPRLALEIAKDHLSEEDEYYDFLEEMEREMQGGGGCGINESKDLATELEPFGHTYEKLANQTDKARAKGYNWRDEAQIHQFEYKVPKGRGNELEDDFDILDYKEKVQKPKKF